MNDSKRDPPPSWFASEADEEDGDVQTMASSKINSAFWKRAGGSSLASSDNKGDPQPSWFVYGDEEDGDVRTMESSNINSAFWKKAGGSSLASSDNSFRHKQIDVIKQQRAVSVSSQEDDYQGSLISDGDIFTVDFNKMDGNQIDYENETTTVSEMENAQRDYEDFSDPPVARPSTTGSSGDPPAEHLSTGELYSIEDLVLASKMAKGEGGSLILESSFDGSTIASRPTLEGPSFISAYGGYGYGANDRNAVISEDPESESGTGVRSYDGATLSSRPTGGAPSFISYYASEKSSTGEGDASGETTERAKRNALFCTPKTLAVFGIILLMAAGATLIAAACSRGSCGVRDKSTASSIVDDEMIGPDGSTPSIPTTVAPTTPSQTTAPTQTATLLRTPSPSPGTVDTTDPPTTDAPTQVETTPEPTPEATQAPTTAAPTDPPATDAPTQAETTPAPTDLPATDAPTQAVTPEPTREATQAPTTAPPTDPPATDAPTQAETTPEPTLEETQTPTIAPTRPSSTDEPTETEPETESPSTGGAVVDLPLETCEPCSENNLCLSRSCSRGFCDDDDGLRCNGVPCLGNGQCISGRCDPTVVGLFDKRCQEKLPDGSPCTHRSDCISNRCTLFFCVPT